MSDIAANLLDKYWDGLLPVNVRAIAASMGITISDRPNMPESGAIQMTGPNQCVIECNANESVVRQRFTIAHEIGHFALGHLNNGSGKQFRDPPSNFSSGSASVLEREANSFAAKLLMPEKVVRFAVNQRGYRSLSRLATLFNVSEVAMKYRLLNLGMLVT